MNLSDLIRIMLKEEASDLHLKVNSPPFLRVHGGLVPVEGTSPLNEEEVRSLAFEMMEELAQKKFKRKKEADFAFDHPDGSRFRVNVYMERGSPCVSMRHIPTEIPNFSDLSLPEVMEK
ncbi:MAG: type IV pili twitching motility protein PilT, partial [Actinomycetia bacterium]|nr:type IV pili twitching motility protein PilT [Actinomycetes bacterium]